MFAIAAPVTPKSNLMMKSQHQKICRSIEIVTAFMTTFELSVELRNCLLQSNCRWKKKPGMLHKTK